MRVLPFAVAALGSALAGLVAVRTTEVQPPVLVIAVVCIALGFAVPRLAWAWAFIVGLGVFLGYVICFALGLHVADAPQIGNQPNIYGSLIALIPAFICAYIGASARWIAGPGLLSDSNQAH